MVDVAEVRKRLIHTIERVKHDAVMRRQETDKASADYERFLELVATPVFRHFSQALRSVGQNFQLFTPAGSVRLASERRRMISLSWRSIRRAIRSPSSAASAIAAAAGSLRKSGRSAKGVPSTRSPTNTCSSSCSMPSSRSWNADVAW